MNLKKLNIDADLSYRDIGAELGCSDFTVMKIEQQAINKLKAILDQKGLTFDMLIANLPRQSSYLDNFEFDNERV